MYIDTQNGSLNLDKFIAGLKTGPDISDICKGRASLSLKFKTPSTEFKVQNMDMCEPVIVGRRH